MAEGKAFNLTSFLLSLVVGLIAFFGTISVNYLGEMNDSLNVVITTNAVQDNRIENMQKDQAEIKGFYQDVIKIYAKKEDEITLKPAK